MDLRNAFDVHMAQRSSELVSKVSLKEVQDSSRRERVVGKWHRVFAGRMATANSRHSADVDTGVPGGSKFAEAMEQCTARLLNMSSRRRAWMRPGVLHMHRSTECLWRWQVCSSRSRFLCP